MVGAAVLVVFGAPNRRPTAGGGGGGARRPPGWSSSGLELRRADGGRTQLYDAYPIEGDPAFLKVYGRDSRDADLLYRATAPRCCGARPTRGRRRTCTTTWPTRRSS